jgi:pyridoxamine 5'-phosphate oxidase
MNLDERRAALEARGLDRADLADDPMTQFRSWYDAVVGWGLYLPEAMVLSTVDEQGRPSSRQVLLRGIDHGLLFFTNLESRKAREIAANLHVSLCLTWHEVQRQVRVRGVATVVTEAESDAYFASRMRASQVGAWASPQSEVIADRSVLEERVREVEARFPEGDVPRPPNWGGFRVVPDEVEFWQGRAHRLHDRFRYLRGDHDGWRIDRLAP